MRSGARAGAKAGARAGMEAGATAGATAGFRAAVNMTTRTLQDALNTLLGDSAQPYKINVKDGEVVSVTGPGMEATGGGAAGATSLPGSAGAAGTAGTTGSSGSSSSSGSSGSSSTSLTAGSAGATGAGGGAGGGGTGVGSPGVGTSGATGAGVSGASGAVGIGGQTGTAESSQVTSSLGGAGGMGVGGGKGAVVGCGKQTSGEGNTDYFCPYRELTYMPKPGEDPQAKARELVWQAGGARKSKSCCKLRLLKSQKGSEYRNLTYIIILGQTRYLVIPLSCYWQTDSISKKKLSEKL